MTRRAAVIPGHWTAVVVADVDSDGPTPILRSVVAESFEVGRIVNDELGQPRHQWDEADIELAVRCVMQRIIELKAESVLIEWATTKTSKNHALASAIKQACFAHDIESTYAKKWSIWNSTARREWVNRRILESYQGWPSGPSGTFRVVRECGVMLLESISSDRPPQFPAIPKEATHVPNLESSDAKLEAAPVTPGETSLEARGDEARRREDAEDLAVVRERRDEPSTAWDRVRGKKKKKPAAPVELLPRTAGIDPGAGYLGVVITEGTELPVQLVRAETFPVGETVALKRPRKIKRGDETFIQTTRRSLTTAMAGALADKIVAMLVDYRVTKLAIEHVESVHIDSQNPGAASSIATAVIRSSWLDILIGERAEAAGIEVHRVAASTWRARVVGHRKKRGGPTWTELIEVAVPPKIRGWSAESDVHERDAAGVNLWLVLPPPEAIAAEKKRRAARTTTPKPREPGMRSPSYYEWNERRRKETAQAREAAGCKCRNNSTRGGGRHRTGCPLAC